MIRIDLPGRQPVCQRRRPVTQGPAQAAGAFATPTFPLNARFWHGLNLARWTFLCENVFMRTTLDLPDETFRQLKAQAALNGLKLKELVTQLIQHGLAAGVTQPAPTQPRSPLPVAIRRDTYPIPIAREADGTVTPYLTNAELYALLDDEDLAQYQRVLSQVPGQVPGQ